MRPGARSLGRPAAGEGWETQARSGNGVRSAGERPRRGRCRRAVWTLPRSLFGPTGQEFQTPRSGRDPPARNPGRPSRSAGCGRRKGSRADPTALPDPANAAQIAAGRGGSRRAGGGQGYGDAPEAITRPGHCLPGSAAALTWRSRRQRRSRESARPPPCRQHGGAGAGAGAARRARGTTTPPPAALPAPPSPPRALCPAGARPAGGAEAAAGVSMAARAAPRAVRALRPQPAAGQPPASVGNREQRFPGYKATCNSTLTEIHVTLPQRYRLILEVDTNARRDQGRKEEASFTP